MISKLISASEPISRLRPSGVSRPHRQVTARDASIDAHAAGVNESDVFDAGT